MKARMFWMLLGCLLVFGGVFAIKAFLSSQQNAYFDNMPMPTVAVSSATATQDDWALTLNAIGTLRAVNGVQVSAQTGGEVSSIRFESGDSVSKGDILLTLDDRADRAQLAAAEASARLAEQDFQRIERLFQQGSISRAERDNREAQRDQTRAQASSQRELLNQKTIRAPFAGVLGIRQVDLGQYLQPGAAIVSLQQLDPVLLNFSLPEQQLALVEKGQAVQIEVDAFAGQTFSGAISAIEPGIDPATRNVMVQAQLANPEKQLRPGMFANVSLQLPQSDSLVVIPRTAVSFAPYGNSVFVINEAEDGTLLAERTVVRLGRQRGDLVAVEAGLKPGDLVATSGLLKLRPGATVTLQNEVQPSADANPTPPNS